MSLLSPWLLFIGVPVLGGHITLEALVQSAQEGRAVEVQVPDRFVAALEGRGWVG